MITAKYFKEAEFKRCTPSCSLQDMDQKLMDTLKDAVMHHIAGITGGAQDEQESR